MTNNQEEPTLQITMSLTSPSPSPAAIAPDEGTIHTGTVSSVHSYGAFIKIPGYAKQGTRLFHSCVATPVESYCSHLNNAYRHAAPLPGSDVWADSARARAKSRGTLYTATGPTPRHEYEPGVALNVGQDMGNGRLQYDLDLISDPVGYPSGSAQGVAYGTEQTPPASHYIACLSCGASVHSQYRFCPYCGGGTPTRQPFSS